ncbi:hypothetical protein [Novosphingobium acidiphilum]|jgi:hypothetical protein|uniref:hypothetical protein n=1 Tax=Novosphingobium acidiphilum TaxID=505248 RepID=UPI00040CF177|nr:hypothetical protein [Novosphingobium acidiphilum]
MGKIERKGLPLKIGFGLTSGVMILVILAIVATAWIKGGVRPATPVEIPVSVNSGAAGGA